MFIDFMTSERGFWNLFVTFVEFQQAAIKIDKTGRKHKFFGWHQGI